MKKKISLLALILVLVLSFTGCGKTSALDYDETELEQYASYLLQNFSGMTEENFENFENMSDLELNLTLLQVGLPVSGEDFLSMISAWRAGVEECGPLVSIGGCEAKETNDGVDLILEADFEERNGTIQISFDDKMNMESLTVNAEYSTGRSFRRQGLIQSSAWGRSLSC